MRERGGHNERIEEPFIDTTSAKEIEEKFLAVAVMTSLRRNRLGISDIT
jgi:hypothetical protein